MAFKMYNIEPVEIGRLKVTPEITGELRLRLQTLDISADNLDGARELLSQCFGSQAKQVLEEMQLIPFVQEYQMLQVYLLQGERGIKLAQETLRSEVSANVEKLKSAKDKEDQNA